MRCCDLHDILLLGRTCRAAHHAASAPFPWALLAVPLCSLQCELMTSLPHSLLRFAQIDLQWLTDTPRVEQTASAIDAVCSLPRIRSLGAFDMSGVEWSAVLLRRCFAHLESLRLSVSDNDVASRCGAAVMTLAQLRSFHWQGPPIDLYDPLRAMTALRELSLDLSVAYLAHEVAPIAECAWLVRLELRCPVMPDLRCWLSPKQLALRSVVLWESHLSADDRLGPGHPCDAFNAPPVLEHVTLICVKQSELVFRQLAQSLSVDGPLRVLTIVPSFRDPAPDVTVLLAVLTRLPLLVRLEWELFEACVTNVPRYAAKVQGGRILVRGRALRFESRGTVVHQLKAARTAGESFAQVDSRIVIVKPENTYKELEGQMRRRFHKQP